MNKVDRELEKVVSSMEGFIEASKSIDLSKLVNFTVVDINNVARWVLEEWQKNVFNADKWLTCVAPPFEIALFKFHFRDRYTGDDRDDPFKLVGAAKSAYAGVLANNIVLNNDTVKEIITEASQKKFDFSEYNDLRFITQLSFHFSEREDMSKSVCTGSALVYLDNEGFQIGHPVYKFNKYEQEYIKDMLIKTFGPNIPEEELENTAKEIATGNMNGFMAPVFVAISLMHCKNVELVDKPVKRQQIRKAKRQGVPYLVEKILTIDAFKRKIQNVNTGEGTGLQRAMHICHGHFREYTDENPLFGKYVGRYFIPQHIRGNRQIGKVDKEYEIV